MIKEKVKTKKYKRYLFLSFLIVVLLTSILIGNWYIKSKLGLQNFSTFIKYFAEYTEFRKSGLNLPNKPGLAKESPRFIEEYNKFVELGGKVTSLLPIINEYDKPSADIDTHYFYSDLLVASSIYKANPLRHIDVGSRIDGFVAHVASFRSIEVLDIRPLNNLGIGNIKSVQVDLMNTDSVPVNICDSISSLSVLEHFGLGRYGDKIDPKGHIRGFNNILKMLKPGGTAYISFLVGPSNEVIFNAHRVFDPLEIFNWPEVRNSIELIRFDYVDHSGKIYHDIDLLNVKEDHEMFKFIGTGIYSFRKIK